MGRDLVAELVMGRVCYGPSLSWAEFVMGRDVPESSSKRDRVVFGRVVFGASCPVSLITRFIITRFLCN